MGGASAPSVVDPLIPSAAELLGDRPAAALHAAVAPDGGVIRAIRRDQVLYSPGRRIAVRFSADVGWRDGSASRETLVAVATGDAPIALWRAPRDPQLPGLAQAMDPAFVSRLLAALGRPAGAVQLRTRAYRPERRAVVEVTGESGRLVYRPGGDKARLAPGVGRLFLKVVRPGQAAPLRALHARLAEELPVPVCLDCSDEMGLLVLEAVPGRTLRRSPAPPPPSELLALLDRLGRVDPDGPARPPATARVRDHVRLLAAVVPEQRDRLEQLAARIGDGSPQPRVMTHGDFHEGQVLVSDGRVSGLLDVDDAGPGAHADDLATMAGRLAALASRPGQDRAYARSVYDAFSERVGREELRNRVAAVILGRATGPFRNQLEGWRADTVRRIELAESWLTLDGERALREPRSRGRAPGVNDR